MSEVLEESTAKKLTKREKKAEKKVRLKNCRKLRRQEEKRQNMRLSTLSVDISEYYFSDGFRRVYPYYYTYEAYAKRRWLGKSLLEVLNGEFHCHSYRSFEDAINHGIVKVHGAIVNPDYILKDNDFITHMVHRHEFPVLDIPIDTVFEDDHMVIVNKPSSIPIHPCGRYNLNSLVYILAKQYGRQNLRSVHRLDRMTSGLVIFGKDYDTATRFANDIAERRVKKTYLTLVEGEFPDTEDIVCNEPLGPLCPRFGLHRVLPVTEGGKPSETLFRRLSYNSVDNVSVVECFPRTGRTHQIRLHLQYLGYPIKNDPLYNCEAWGPQKGRGGDYGGTPEQVIATLSKIHSRNRYILDDSDNTNDVPQDYPDEEEQVASVKRQCLDTNALRNTYDPLKVVKDSSCVECRTVFTDPNPSDLCLFLHAYEYEGPNWKFTSPLPSWANGNVHPKHFPSLDNKKL